MTEHSTSRLRRAFTLTEMLVVVGIIALLVGLLVPALTRARASARATKCMNNLRQIGTFYMMYADQNDDRIPLGVSESLSGLSYPTMETTPGPSAPDGYLTARNHYIWVGGRPSAAGGPLLSAGLVKIDDAKLFYCPVDDHGKDFGYNTPQNPWPVYENKLAEGVPATTRIDYAVRPVIGQVWHHDCATCVVTYPDEMARLSQQHAHAVMAELPQVPPANHGVGAGAFINVLYGDQSVRPCHVQKYASALKQYVAVADGLNPGGPKPLSSSKACISADPRDETIWRALDEN